LRYVPIAFVHSLISLAGVMRSEYNTAVKGEMMDRTQMLFKIAQRLKALAVTFDMGVLVVNQVGHAVPLDCGAA
jgi:hypothetical protein